MFTPMKKLLPSMFWAACCLSPVTLNAQYTRTYGLFGAGGSATHSTHERSYFAGGGLERLLNHGIGIGGEVSAILPASDVSGRTIGLASLDGYYHLQRKSKLVPYASAGFSLLFRDYVRNGANYGLGTVYWFEDNMGLVIDARDHIGSLPNAQRTHFWGFRVGLTWK
jgi:hypothetical protein